VVTMRLADTAAFEQKGLVCIYRITAWNRYFFTLAAFWRAFRLARHADVVHTTTYNAAFPAWLAARLCGKKVVLTVHEVLGKKWFQLPDISKVSAAFFRLYEWLLFRVSFDTYVCVSEATQRDLLELCPAARGKVEVIYNGIDYEKWQSSGVREGAVRKFMYYGRSGCTKGVSVLLQAWQGVAGRCPDATLELLLAPYPQKAYHRLLGLLKALDISASVTVLPSVSADELPGVVSDRHCVVIPSLTEGFGFTAAEASALQMPLVVTDAGALPEVACGRVCWAKKGDVESLQQALLQASSGVFEHRSLRRFALDSTVEQYRLLYVL
jgi:glycosyltransferase involved in cell wall biosynthesis